MNTNILTDISRNLLGGGYLDLQFLVNTIEENSLDFDDIAESIECSFGKDYIADINTYIYEALSQIANNFINENMDLFEQLSDEYEIFTNYLDSHVWFTDSEVQDKFEEFYY